MCGIVGMYSQEYDESHTELFKQIFRESQIRGRHASGISYLKGKKVVTKSEPISADEFVDKIGIPNTNIIIGHCRYSTSDLEYNQPIGTKKMAIAHNGIITQSDPENWEKRFGYKFKTKNDSEIILRNLEKGKKHPLVKYKDSSMAVVAIGHKGNFKFFRNGNRPLYYHNIGEALFVASTKDILIRAFKKITGENIEPAECINGYQYSFGGKESRVDLIFDDYDNQQLLRCPDNYLKVEHG